MANKAELVDRVAKNAINKRKMFQQQLKRYSKQFKKL